MKTSIALERLHEDYNKDISLGCMDRAILLCCIMRSNNSNPQLVHFYFVNRSGIKEEFTDHYVVVSKNEVYDCNEELNPTIVSEYQEKEKEKHPGLRLVWEDPKEFIKNNHFISDSLKYLESRFDKEFQEEVEPLIRKHYEEGLNGEGVKNV